MARSFLVVLIASLPLAAFAADPSPSPSPALAPPAVDAMPAKPPARPDGPWSHWDKDRPRHGDDAKRSPNDDDGPISRFKKRLQEMSPEEREHFKQNWQKWKGMAQGEQNDWRKRANAEQQRMKKAIDDAIASAGLTLSDDQKEVFALRYRQERRRVEEELHAEFEAKRDEKMKAVLAQLKTEFSESATPAAMPTPTPSPTP